VKSSLNNIKFLLYFPKFTAATQEGISNFGRQKIRSQIHNFNEYLNNRQFFYYPWFIISTYRIYFLSLNLNLEFGYLIANTIYIWDETL